MKMDLAIWLVIILVNFLVAGGVFNWEELKKELDEQETRSIVKMIVDEWENRPPDSFHNISKEWWERIIPNLGDYKLSSIGPEEFASSEAACRAFAKYLSKLSSPETLPDIFRQAVYNLLIEERNQDNVATTKKENDRVVQVIKSIPSSWMESHGRLFISILIEFNPPRLKYLNKETLTTLFNNSNNACQLITLNALLSLEPGDVALLSPTCINAINGLGTMDLSKVIGHLREDAFAWYNGPLSRKTIELLSGEQVQYYGHFIRDEQICTLLGLHYLDPVAAVGITTNCLYGYLNGYEEMVGLGVLWKSIPESKLNAFTQLMRLSSWVRIPLGDFDHMPMKLLKVILPTPQVCPTIKLSFWSEERISYISSECLYRILTEPGTFVVALGRLWERIGWSIVERFTDTMRSSWLKINIEDFDFIKPPILGFISSTPGICSILKVSFWTVDRIRNISGQCLFEILTKHGAPTRLGELWSYIPLSSVYDFTKKIEFSWGLIHLDDYTLLAKSVKRTILVFPGVCASLSLPFWTRYTVKYLKKSCLYKILTAKKEPVELGELWGHIPRLTVQDFKILILRALKRVAGSDFQHMTLEFLRLIFASNKIVNYLPQPFETIILSSRANGVEVNSMQFAEIAKSAPNVAGQLLWYSLKLPEDVLSKCDGNDIRNLTVIVPGKMQLDWRGGLFTKLEEKYSLAQRVEFFSQMVRLISIDSDFHLCHTLNDPDEYMSLTWLHRNLSNSCRSALRFDSEYITELFGGLEVEARRSSLKNMLEIYDHTDWFWLFQSQKVGSLLAGDCDFWSEIDTGKWPDVLKVLDVSVLKGIIPDCVLLLGNTLRQNPGLIPFLADDAFSKHLVNKLPCRLEVLSPAQISQLSKQTIKNLNGPTKEEISNHALSRITLEDLKALNSYQFKSIYESQWPFIPETISNEGLDWQISVSQDRILKIASVIKSKCEFPLRFISYQSRNFKFLEEELGLLLEMYKGGNGHQLAPPNPSHLATFIAFIKKSELRQVFIDIFKRSSLLRPNMISLICSAEELRRYIHNGFPNLPPTRIEIDLPHDPTFGFDRSSIINFLKEKPELFANPGARVISQGINDIGGPMRALTSQLLNDVKRDLLVPCIATPKSNKGSLDGIKMYHESPELLADMIVVENTGGGGNVKFVWGISREVGQIVGLGFGKALQLDIKLPFALGPIFYELLIDASDQSIENYYSYTYCQEIANFQQVILDFFNSGDFEGISSILTKPESLRFTRLSVKVKVEEARSDVKSKTNLWGCQEDNECYDDIERLQDRDFIENCIKSVLERLQNEFKEFIRELVDGLGMALPSMKEFKNLPIPFLRPFSIFLPKLLDAKPFNGEDVLARVKFNNDGVVESLINGHGIAASMVFSAFVLCLEEKQLEHLLGLWTGSSTISLGYSELGVTFISPGNIEPYSINFCDSVSETLKSKKDHMITPGKEYQKFFKRFTRHLLGPNAPEVVIPACDSRNSGIIPIRPSTCAKDLMIYLQSAEQIFKSLIDLLCTPLTILRDD